jgi:hypothetical protein
MSGIIHFTSGKKLEINEYEYLKIAPKLKGGGIRLMQMTGGHLIPLNSNTMEMIEHIEEKVANSPIVINKKQTMGITELPEEQKEQVEKPKVKTAEEVMADITAKSNCKHEPEKTELYIQHTTKGLRYFPVCNFCGKRDRYISESKIVKGEYKGTPNEKWTEKDIANAKPWIED